MAVRKFMTNNLVKEHDMYVEFMKKRNEEMKNSGAEPTEVLFYKYGLMGTRTDYAKDDYISICKWHCITITYDIWCNICNQLYSSRIKTNELFKDLVDVPDDALRKFKYRVEQSIKNAKCDYNSKRGFPHDAYDAPRYLAMFWTYLDIVKDTKTQRFYPTADTRKRAAKIFRYAEYDDPFIMNGKYYNRANKKEKPMVEQTSENITDILNTSIHDIGLSVRTSNPLARYGIKTFEDLRNKTIDDLMHIRNFGMRSLREVIDVLAKYGYYYPKNPNATEEAEEDVNRPLIMSMYEKDQLPVLMTGAEDEPEEEPKEETTLEYDELLSKYNALNERYEQLKKLSMGIHERNKELSAENSELKAKIDHIQTGYLEAEDRIKGLNEDAEELRRNLERNDPNKMTLTDILDLLIRRCKAERIPTFTMTYNNWSIAVNFDGSFIAIDSGDTKKGEVPSYGTYRIRTTEV